MNKGPVKFTLMNNKIKKDGHFMFQGDIVKDLNYYAGKSYDLQQQVTELEDNEQVLNDHNCALMTKVDKLCKENEELNHRLRLSFKARMELRKALKDIAGSLITTPVNPTTTDVIMSLKKEVNKLYMIAQKALKRQALTEDKGRCDDLS